MSTNLIRMRNAAIASKIEVTTGLDSIGGTPANADIFRGDVTIAFNQETVPDPSLTGSLDSAPSIVGGLRPTITIRTPLRGSGTASTAPEWGRLLRCCAYAETTQAAAVGVPTALGATGHTTTEVTLPSTPFGNTAQQYRGLPLILSGVVSSVTGIWDYSTSRVAKLLNTLSGIPVATTSAQIPANVLYSPTSDETVFRTATLYFYADGLRWRFLGCVGTWSVEMTTGGVAFLVFTMRGQFLDTTATALPAGWNTTNPLTPPRFVGGLCQLDNSKAQVRSLTFDAGVNVILPDDPEASDGVGPALPISRASGGRLDPLMNVTNYVSLFDKFRVGTPMALGAIVGTTAGNRFLIMSPAAKVLQNDPTNRDGLGANSMTFAADGPDAGTFLCAF
jgi:hypothetical protein